MKLKVTISGSGTERDVVVTADVTATIGSLAERLSGGRTGADGVPLTLRVWAPGRVQARLLNPSATVHESSLRSGCRVEVVAATDRRRGDDVEDAPAALLQVLTGPEAGHEYLARRVYRRIDSALDRWQCGLRGSGRSQQAPDAAEAQCG